MVEANNCDSDEFNKIVLEAKDSEFKTEMEKRTVLKNAWEELKKLLMPKILIATRELEEVSNIIKAF
jgi:hypothetical protein